MGGGQAGDGYAEGGAGDVVEAQAVAEGDALGVAAVLAADADLQVRAHLAPGLHGQFDQLAHAIGAKIVDRMDR